MKQQQGLVGFIILGFILLAGAFLLPWHSVRWGKLEWLPASTITVSGTAKTQQKNEVAHFNAGVSAINDDKTKAVGEVNQKVTALTQAVKDFGIPEADIKTQNVSVFQMEEMKTVGGRQKSQPGQWRAGNDISITLRDLTKASALTDLLMNSGATNVNGPNFTVDNTQNAEVDLMSQAIQNARDKAQAMAVASGRTLGTVINVVEGYASGPVIPLYEAKGMGGGGAPLEPGTQTVSKIVTVTFELK